MSSCESWMKGVQQRIESRAQADPRIMLRFGPLGFRSQPIVVSPLPRPHKDCLQPPYDQLYLSIEAKPEGLQGYHIKKELDSNS